MVDQHSKSGVGIKEMTLNGMLFAAAIVLSIVEGMLPIPLPVPGVKLGLANIVVMYALFFQNKKSAFLLTILKAFFAAATRGLVAGCLSLSGGLCSIGVMLLIYYFSKGKASYFVMSMFGALAHNMGQFLAITLIYTGFSIWYYLPVLVISGIAAGLATSILLRCILPALKRVGLNKK